MSDEQMLQHIGIYIGKTFRRNFDRKLEDGTVQKDGGKIFGITLKEKVEDEYGRSFTIFDNTKGFDTIEEGDKIKLGYVIKEFTGKHGPGKSNTVQWVGKTEDPCTPRHTQPSRAPNQISTFNESDFNDMVFKYKSAVTDAKDYAPIQLLGMYLLNFKADEFWGLYERCCKELGIEVPKR